MNKDTALRLALEALETSMYPQQKQLQAITAIKAALEAKDEPVGVVATDTSKTHIYHGTQYLGQKTDTKMVMLFKDLPLGTPVYTTPPQREAKDEPVAVQPLPCPFCGHVGLDFADGETYRWGVASCGGCGASCGDIRREYPDLGEWHTEAIAEWNRRSPAPQRTWVGLTDKELNLIGTPWHFNLLESKDKEDLFAFIQAIEAKLKEKNT